ncbi:insulinase family protein [bacterium]|nr:MAG: insulinase family protein [bacterium]
MKNLTKINLIVFALLVGLTFTSCRKNEDNMENMANNKVLIKIDGDPLIAYNIWFKVGSVNDPKGKEGLAYITAEMLADASTKKNNYSAIIDQMYPMATGYGAKVDKEMTTFRGRVHKDNLEKYNELFLDAILDPAFKEEDFTRIKNNTLNYIKNELRYSSDEELGKFSLYDYVFEGTPYGHLMSGTVDGLESITLQDVKDFYKKYYNRNNYVIGLGGGFNDGLVEKVQSRLNQLPDTTVNSKVDIKPEAIDGLNVLLVEKENSSTAISFGFPIDVLRGDDDFFALALFSSWFGEHRNQSSHLFQVIRGQRGLNYGDYSYIERFLNGGALNKPDPNNARNKQLFEVWIRPVQHVHRHFALRAAMRELKAVVDNGMTEKDFETTKNFLNKYSLHWAETNAERLGYEIDSKFYGIDDGGNYINYFRDKIMHLTLDQVNKAIKKHIQYKNIKIAMITNNAEQFKNDLVNNTPSPIKYDSPKPDNVLEADKEISVFPLDIKADKVKIVPVDKMFQK